MRKSYLVDRLLCLFDIAKLSDREKIVVISRFVEKLSLDKTRLKILKDKDCIRREWGSENVYCIISPKGSPVGRDRVRCIQVKALRKLRHPNYIWMLSEYPKNLREQIGL